MSWQQASPLSSLPQPYATRGSSNPTQNKASDSAHSQDNLPHRRGYPPVQNASVSPCQVYSSQPPPSSRRSTHPTSPTHEHASSSPRQPAPPPSGSVSHNQPYPARYASITSSNPPPPMTKRAETMPMPVHPNIPPSVPYDMSPHPPSRSEIPGRPQTSSQNWSYRDYPDVDEGEDEPSDPSSGEPENSQEGMSDLIYWSQPSIPFAGRKSHGRRPGKDSSGGSPATDQLPCRLCRKLSPRHIIEHWGGFCCERHRTQWMLAYHSP